MNIRQKLLTGLLAACLSLSCLPAYAAAPAPAAQTEDSSYTVGDCSSTTFSVSSSAIFRMSSVMRIEQYFGPHMLQK